MTEPTAPKGANHAAIGTAFLGAGGALLILGSVVMHNLPLTAAGGGIVIVGIVFAIRGMMGRPRD